MGDTGVYMDAEAISWKFPEGEDPLCGYTRTLLSREGSVAERLARLQRIEDAMREDAADPDSNALADLVPGIGRVHRCFPLVRTAAFLHSQTGFLDRRKVPVTPHEMRILFNTAEIEQFSADPSLQLITFDGDGTLYDDGHCLKTGEMTGLLCAFMARGITVALATAAGYPAGSKGLLRYTQRVEGLLKDLQARNAPDDVLRRFYIIGGECNYLLRCVRKCENVVLEYVDDKEWKTEDMLAWDKEEIKSFLEKARDSLVLHANRLKFSVTPLMKEYAVGIAPKRPDFPTLSYGPALNEITLCVREDLSKLSAYKIPFCIFKGRTDVFVDIGDKGYGIRALREFLGKGIACSECIHVGDQFSNTGNDAAAREQSLSLWTGSPEETIQLSQRLLRALDGHTTLV